MKAYCITLPETADRYAAARKHFKDVGLSVRFMSGIHAETFGLKTVHNYEIDNPGSGYNIGYKNTGCCLSHYMLWTALAWQPENHFLVLEDDALFPKDWHPRTMQALASTPQDFDMLFIGSCCCEGREKTSVSGDVYEVKYPLCTHAYIVSKNAIPVLLSTQRKVWANLDIALFNNSFPKLKVFTVLPRIVDQRNMELAP